MTGPASSATGPANVCTAPAAPAAVDTPARTTCAAPPATPATTLETPGIFTRHPSLRLPRLMILTCGGPVHTWAGKVKPCDDADDDAGRASLREQGVRLRPCSEVTELPPNQTWGTTRRRGRR